jgi:hypothetical protein
MFAGKVVLRQKIQQRIVAAVWAGDHRLHSAHAADTAAQRIFDGVNYLELIISSTCA